ncbi:MAG: 30S ribosomal protein S1 [Microgenomates group bacterium GW2011_GWA1_Microgenomates_45_10]|nr:MAG: 30S ribosomal protein S1 [Microgenomates group bacterium GW2011_GWA2_44_7]KKT77904.1 MAG: 30S ribosomal protein S1 [Microgenomates group bacterium GW2011_GWB1_44_8]KKT86642.1 MAG: 30S ribosomal protein S1 [Microgenomates group bacterium GW2011_GWA1_Microgenomates_45_10]
MAKQKVNQSTQPADSVSKQVSGKRVTSASTMEELLASDLSSFKAFKPGDKVKGKITEITGKALFIDVGGKSDAVVAGEEFDASREEIRGLKVGQEIEGMVVVPENEAGQMLLSLNRANSDSRWSTVEKLAKAGGVIEVVGKEITKGGLLVGLDDLVGFIPGSQLGRQWLGRAEELLGKKFNAVVLEADKVSNRLVFSQRAISDAEELTHKKETLSRVNIGDEYKGNVTGVMPFGIFVKIKIGKAKGGKAAEGLEGVEELEGLVHISELSWTKITDPKSAFVEGQEVEVKVIGVEEESGKLALSLKQLQSDPWQNLVKKYPVDSKVKGKVTRLASFGAFVQLEDGIEGLLHISKIPADLPIKPGDEVECFVESIEPEKRRLGLGLVLKAKAGIYK